MGQLAIQFPDAFDPSHFFIIRNCAALGVKVRVSNRSLGAKDVDGVNGLIQPDYNVAPCARVWTIPWACITG